jgi:hypothetical protein
VVREREREFERQKEEAWRLIQVCEGEEILGCGLMMNESESCRSRKRGD